MEMEKSIEAASHVARENPYTVLETSLLMELDRLSLYSLKTASHCIHRVPSRLRLVCEKAYTPQLISIGPLHHGAQALEGMEEHKMRYLRYFLGRTNLSLMHYIEKVKDREADLRSCYSETIKLGSDDFVKIILVDAIFIIEFLFRYCGWVEETQESDCIFGSPNLLNHVRLDLLLIENQLPFFILEDLFDPDIFPFPSNYSDRLGDVESISIIFLSHFFLCTAGVYIRRAHTVPNLETICCSQVKVKHFVDLLTRFYVAPFLKPEAARQPTARALSLFAPSIEELHQAGVQFKVGHSSNSLLDIKFKDGILEIPKLEVTDETETVLRNLVAFEQCDLGGQKFMSDYVCMMDYLVDTPKDVGLLVEYGIVRNSLGGGNDELSTLMNSLPTKVCISPTRFNYASLCQDLNEYCRSPWRRWIAILRQKYLVGGGVLLLLTIIQTICSIASINISLLVPEPTRRVG